MKRAYRKAYWRVMVRTRVYRTDIPLHRAASIAKRLEHQVLNVKIERLTTLQEAMRA